MKLAIDVGYHENGATAAGVIFEDWTDARPADEISIHVQDVEPYQPGQFYRRELPCIAALLRQLQEEQPSMDLDTVVVDGFVWLSKQGLSPKPGLGAHLFEFLEQQIFVVGVAKTNFAGSGAARLLRGQSKRPLFVSAAGIELNDAIHAVKIMHGAHRLPNLLKRVDQLSRVQLA